MKIHSNANSVKNTSNPLITVLYMVIMFTISEFL